ncbi:MAG: AMP-binding protein, partial [Candidatus Competibacteraceae bacterium]|nr:AMP-binding protein [Candidatus Competibacteraceae bacterium]
MERLWLKSYPPGVPADIDLNQYASLKEVIEDSCRRFADRPAYSNLGRVLTYRELEALSARFGAWLYHEAGLSRGDRVAIMLPNLLQYPVVLFGALRAGLTVVNINPLYTARELEHQLADSGARAIVVLENFAHTLQRVIKKTRLETVVVTRIGDLLPFPKNWLVTLAVRHLKRMVPPW